MKEKQDISIASERDVAASEGNGSDGSLFDLSVYLVMREWSTRTANNTACRLYWFATVK